MSEQTPFTTSLTLASNLEPRCPCMLLLDFQTRLPVAGFFLPSLEALREGTPCLMRPPLCRNKHLDPAASRSGF